jgi:AcrR family transcriptional regulator
MATHQTDVHGRVARTSDGAATRARIVQACADLFRQQGLPATGVNDIARHAGVPSGSLYHFFPGGKVELAAEAIRVAGRGYEDLVLAIYEAAPDPLTGLDDVFAGAAQVLVDTGWADACPIATVALEVASTSEPLREATAAVFDSWLDVLTERLHAAGVRPKAARAVALQIVMLLEGGFLLSRALRTTEPMEAAGAAAAVLTRAALPPGFRRRPRG